MYFLMMLSAVVLVGVGIVRLLFFGKEYVYLPTKSKIAEYSVFFRSDAKRAVIDAIESGNIAALDKIKKDDNSGIRFDIVMSDDCKFASCQVFEWVPHFFEPASKVYVLDEETVSKIRDYIEREHVSPVN